MPMLPTLPAIIAVLGRSDSGEYGNATCPHCGAQGRYVFSFLCSDGTKRGAMAGCIKLFPRDHVAGLLEEAFTRSLDVKQGSTLASWWGAMIQAVHDLEAGRITMDAMRQRVQAAEGQRQGWLRRKGFGRFGRRR